MHSITDQSRMLALSQAASPDEDSSGQRKSSEGLTGTAVVRRAAAAVQMAEWRVADKSAQELLLLAVAAADSRPRLVVGSIGERRHTSLAPAAAGNIAELRMIVLVEEARSTCAVEWLGSSVAVAVVAVGEIRRQSC